jgi:hypothetical protein
MMIDQIAPIIANLALALDYSEEMIDEDQIVEIQEQMGSDMDDLDPESRKLLSDASRRIAPEYEAVYQDAVRTLPYCYGLEEEEE